MKFPQLPLGQRFEYQGETLVKVGAMTACNERGGNTRLIPRSAVVIPLTAQTGPTAASAPPVHPPLATERLQSALIGFETRWRGLLDDLDEATRGHVEETMTNAHAELRDALGLGGPPTP
jgi:hypothetical protein